MRRPLRQWVLKITEYADALLEGLEDVDWPSSTKEMQRNWIGRSEGAELDFPIAGNSDAKIRVYTTRPDTLFGATYMVLAPEHELVDSVTSADARQAVSEYQAAAAYKSELERTELQKEKTGVFTGAYAVNPANGSEIPVWIADYVLAGYGTGAIMAVPAQDERDWEFARAHELPIIRTVEPPADFEDGAYTGTGTVINSGFLDGLSTTAAKEAMIEWLEKEGHGERKINYKLRTGSSQDNAIGASRFRSFLRRAASAVCRRKICRCCCLNSTTSNPADHPRVRSQRQLTGSIRPIVTATPRSVRRIRCRSGPVHAGITCGTSTRITKVSS